MMVVMGRECWYEDGRIKGGGGVGMRSAGRKENGMNEGSYASRCVVMMVQMTFLCVGLGLTPAYLLLRGQLGHSLDMWSP